MDEIERLKQENNELKAQLLTLLEPRNIFSRRLKSARKNLGLNQSDFGVRLGFSQRAISDWERGVREPSINTLVALANTLGVSLDWLCGRTDEL